MQLIMRKDGRFLRQVVPLCKAQVVFLTRAKSSDLTTVRKIPKIYVTLFNCSHQIYYATKPRGLSFSLEMIFFSDSPNCLLQITMSHFIILLYFTWKQDLIKHLWAFSTTIYSLDIFICCTYKIQQSTNYQFLFYFHSINLLLVSVT